MLLSLSVLFSLFTPHAVHAVMVPNRWIERDPNNPNAAAAVAKHTAISTPNGPVLPNLKVKAAAAQFAADCV